MATYVTPPPDFHRLVSSMSSEDLVRVLTTDTDNRAEKEYLHWDKLRHLSPPDGLSSEEWWVRLKFNRRGVAKQLPIRTVDGLSMSYQLTDAALKALHRIDQRSGGSIAMDEVVNVGDEHARKQYLVNSLMEEAIRSSQLEGATTGRRAAKELLRTGRPPRDRSERMILNNYNAMLFMRESIGDTLSSERVLELHRILTEGTLDNPDAAGRLQQPGEDRVMVCDRQTGDVLHRPPPADELPARLEALCAFANASPSEDTPFVHPVVRAVILHFWLGYDHPFEDGNGRTARAIFYWYMRTQGYWLTEYLSISRILRNAPSKYSRAYLFTETDEGDVTYFLLYHLSVIERAIDELHAYLKRKMGEIRAVEKAMKGADGLNHRQIALLSHALRHADATYTMAVHAGLHSVTHETARTDLAGLTQRGLLDRVRSTRPFIYAPPADLPKRLRELD